MARTQRQPQASSAEGTEAAERRERAAMFTFHPAIFEDVVGLPRPSDGSDYTRPPA